MIIVYTYCTFQNMQLFLDHGGKGGKSRETFRAIYWIEIMPPNASINS